jgi:hypothetical protein
MTLQNVIHQFVKIPLINSEPMDKIFVCHSSLDHPTPFLHFCKYIPFEEKLALYLNNLEIPLSKYYLY